MRPSHKNKQNSRPKCLKFVLSVLAGPQKLPSLSHTHRMVGWIPAPWKSPSRSIGLFRNNKFSSQPDLSSAPACLTPTPHVPGKPKTRKEHPWTQSGWEWAQNRAGVCRGAGMCPHSPLWRQWDLSFSLKRRLFILVLPTGWRYYKAICPHLPCYFIQNWSPFVWGSFFPLSILFISFLPSFLFLYFSYWNRISSICGWHLLWTPDPLVCLPNAGTHSLGCHTWLSLYFSGVWILLMTLWYTHLRHEWVCQKNQKERREMESLWPCGKLQRFYKVVAIHLFVNHKVWDLHTVQG